MLPTFWRGKKYHLDKMTMRELVLAFYQHPSVLVYHLLLAAAVVGFFAVDRPGPRTAVWVAVSALNFSLVWYVLHRFVLQSTLLYRFRFGASLWKRIHYDHHHDPNDLRVLFGALQTTLPPMFVYSAVVGKLTGHAGDGLAFLATALVMTLWSEFCHCVQHLPTDPGLGYFRRIRKLHLVHHFQNERVYYGITNFLWDRLFGTYPASAREVVASPSAFHLGYTGEVAARYPWVRRLSEPETPSPEPPVA